MAETSSNPPGQLPTTTDANAANAPAQPTRAVKGLRRPLPRWQSLLYGVLCIALCVGIWHLLTRGEVEERVLSSGILPSVQETVDSFHSLWFDRELTRNLWASLKRVGMGFGLAAVVGIPLGVLCGCFPAFGAFLAPLTIFGRNIPVAALIPLTFSFFGIDEFQKVMFIFIACVAFVVFDTARAIGDIDARYIDTAFTLGANRRQTILKVLVPLSFPSIFNSLRLLFGLAFGYIMLAEVITIGDNVGGLGDIINKSQRRGLLTHIILVLLIIPIVALAIDRILFWIQRELFPYQYGGSGMLHRAVRAVLVVWEGFKGLFRKPVEYAPEKFSHRAPSAPAEGGPSA